MNPFGARWIGPGGDTSVKSLLPVNVTELITQFERPTLLTVVFRTYVLPTLTSPKVRLAGSATMLQSVTGMTPRPESATWLVITGLSLSMANVPLVVPLSAGTNAMSTFVDASGAMSNGVASGDTSTKTSFVPLRELIVQFVTPTLARVTVCVRLPPTATAPKLIEVGSMSSRQR